MERAEPKRGLWLKRLAWLIVLWGASVVVLAIIAYAIRLFMQALGLHT